MLCNWFHTRGQKMNQNSVWSMRCAWLRFFSRNAALQMDATPSANQNSWQASDLGNQRKTFADLGKKQKMQKRKKIQERYHKLSTKTLPLMCERFSAIVDGGTMLSCHCRQTKFWPREGVKSEAAAVSKIEASRNKKLTEFYTKCKNCGAEIWHQNADHVFET